MSYDTAKVWFKKFKSGNYDLDEQPCSGRLTTVDCAAIQQIVEANPTTSTRRISNEIGASKSSVHRHLIALGKGKRSCRIPVNGWLFMGHPSIYCVCAVLFFRMFVSYCTYLIKSPEILLYVIFAHVILLPLIIYTCTYFL